VDICLLIDLQTCTGRCSSTQRGIRLKEQPVRVLAVRPCPRRQERLHQASHGPHGLPGAQAGQPQPETAQNRDTAASAARLPAAAGRRQLQRSRGPVRGPPAWRLPLPQSFRLLQLSRRLSPRQRLWRRPLLLGGFKLGCELRKMDPSPENVRVLYYSFASF
jgi:hypothetical protein